MIESNEAVQVWLKERNEISQEFPVTLCLLLQVVHILNMTTAQVHSFQLSPEESLHSLQKRIEAETKIEVVNQELLQETGVSLDPRKPAAQCVLDGVVSKLTRWRKKKQKRFHQTESCWILHLHNVLLKTHVFSFNKL